MLDWVAEMADGVKGSMSVCSESSSLVDRREWLSRLSDDVQVLSCAVSALRGEVLDERNKLKYARRARAEVLGKARAVKQMPRSEVFAQTRMTRQALEEAETRDAERVVKLCRDLESLRAERDALAARDGTAIAGRARDSAILDSMLTKLAHAAQRRSATVVGEDSSAPWFEGARFKWAITAIATVVDAAPPGDSCDGQHVDELRSRLRSIEAETESKRNTLERHERLEAYWRVSCLDFLHPHQHYFLRLLCSVRYLMKFGRQLRHKLAAQHLD